MAWIITEFSNSQYGVNVFLMTITANDSWRGQPIARNRFLHGLFAGYLLVWGWSAVTPVDRGDWLLESVLALVLVASLILTGRRFQFSNFSYALITVFLMFHAIGAHYSYAKVPVGFWIQDALQLSRNPFDRIVHFAYGFLLAYPIRELLIRLAGVRGWWSYYLPVSAALAHGGLFEVIEAFAAQMVDPDLGAAYLGTQGDQWDAQKDVASAFAGALVTMIGTFAASKIRSQRMPVAPQ